jgi:hypothetical protein
MDERPPIEEIETGAELRRWYWLRSEVEAEAKGRVDLELTRFHGQVSALGVPVGARPISWAASNAAGDM